MASTGRRPAAAAAIYGGAVAAAAAAGGLATSRAVDTWYRRLDKPPWTPPARVFGPVWTLLYAQMATSAVLARDRPRARTLWWTQLALNASWSPLFFGARRVGAAGIVAGALVPAVAATAVASGRRGVAYAPYLAWSAYAAALNASIWRRNR